MPADVPLLSDSSNVSQERGPWLSPNEAPRAAAPPPAPHSASASPPRGRLSLRSRLRRRAGRRPRRTAGADDPVMGRAAQASLLPSAGSLRSRSASEDKVLAAEERTALVRFIVIVFNAA